METPLEVKSISLPNEIWKDVVGLEGVYMISNIGRVFSLTRNSLNKNQKRILKGRLRNTSLNSYGYDVVFLFNSDKKYYPKGVHRLMAESFIGVPENNKMQVNHKNGIRNDNRIENLEWLTPRENTIHSFNEIRGKVKEKVLAVDKPKIKKLKEEFFVYIKGYDNKYKVSNLGRIISLKRGYEILLSVFISRKGYPIVFLSKNGKKRHDSLHRIVASHFIPNPENKPMVNHKNGVRSDFRIENLEWCTPKENVIHSYKVLGKIHNTTGKFNRCAKKVAQYNLNGEFIESFDSNMDVQRKLGINNVYVSRCCLKQCKKTNGFVFRYFDDKPLRKIDVLND